MKNEILKDIMFAILGVIFIIVGLFTVKNVLNYENKIDTVGTITKIITYHRGTDDESHEVYVSYTVDGENYESRLGSYASSFYEGKEIEMYYDKDDPSKIGVKSLDLLVWLFPALGLIFVILGGREIIVELNRKRI